MTFRLFVYMLGYFFHWSAMTLVALCILDVVGVIQVPWLGDVLRNEPMDMFLPIGILYIFGLCGRPHPNVRRLPRDMRARVNRIPLSVIFNRSPGTIFLEITALLTLAAVGFVCATYPLMVIRPRTGSTSGIFHFSACFGLLSFWWAMRNLYVYVHPFSRELREDP